MADIFDQISVEQVEPTGDIFDQIETAEDIEQPIGLIESFKRQGFKRLAALVPFGGVKDPEEKEYFEALKRFSANAYISPSDPNYAKEWQDLKRREPFTPEKYERVMRLVRTPKMDRILMETYNSRKAEEQRRGFTIPAEVGQGVADLAPWMVDIAIAKGLTPSTITRALPRMLTTASIGTALQMSRVDETYRSRRLDHPEEGETTSLVKAYGHTFIENFSELTGEFLVRGGVRVLGPVWKKLPFGKKFLTKLGDLAKRLKLVKSTKDFLNKISTRVGYDGIIGESGEERVATIMHAIAGTEDFGAGPEAGPWDRLKAGIAQDFNPRNLLVETIILSVPGATRYAIGKGIDVTTAIRAGVAAAPAEVVTPIEPPAVSEIRPEAVKPLPDVEEVIKLTSESPELEGVIADISRQADIAFRQDDLDTIHDIVQLTWELPKTPEADALRRRVQILDGEMLARTRARERAEPEAIPPTEPIVETVSIPELVENNEQTLKDAIANVKDGLVPKTEGPVLARREDGKLILGDGYHRVAQAIIEGKKEIQVEIVPEVVPEVRPEVPVEEVPGPEAARVEVPVEPTPVVPEEKIYKGPAYRVETGTEIHPEAKTAADVIRYEQTELGNDLGVTPEQLNELEKRPATDIVWVTRGKREAARYGIEAGREPTAEEIETIPEDYTKDVEGGEVIVDIGPDGVLVLKPEPTLAKPVKLSRKKALVLGHQLPKVLGWDEAQRRDFMQNLVGKSSMKNMTPVEFRTVVEALQTQVREAGLEYVPEELPIEKLVETLERTKKVTELPAIEELNRGEVYKLKRRIKSGLHAFVTGLERMERFFEGLDGHKRGEFTNTIWKPIQQADELSIENTNNEHVKFLDFLESQNIDTTLWLGKTEEIPRTRVKLTPFQKIGVYTLSQNKNSRRQLIRGMGFTEVDITAINDSLTEQERNVADWLMEQYEIQWPVLQQAAAQAGIDLAALKKEFRYTPIVRTDVELDVQEDFLSGLAEPFRQDSFSPERGMLKERKKKAYGRMEIDAAVLYMHNVGRVQRFIQMAPVAKNVGRILNNRKFKEALNTRTYGQGNKLINSWMKDAVRGTITKNTSLFAKAIAIMRRNGILYAIGYNIPSSLRQTLSLSNAVAVDPRMLEHVPVNIAKASTPSGYKTMEDFVYSRSLLAKTRSYDRDLRQKWNRENLKLKLRRKAPWSRRVMRWIRWMDRHTVVVAWKSLYDVGMQKFNNEQQAMTFADKWIGRTQPMANAKDLPNFFRGGTLERLLTTFQNQINNNGNFYAYDIIGAKTTKQISWPMVGYRVMFSWILPAIMFGMIGRAAPPRTLKQLLIDLITYPIAPVLLVHRYINRMIRGWGQSGTVAEIGPEEFVKLGRAIGRGDIYNIIKRAATTIGAITGRIPAQLIRTVEGIIDLQAGTTGDPRRLIYSEWALKQGEPEERKITLSRKRE